MKTIIFNSDTEHSAEKIVKTENSIIGYTDGNEVFSFRGISKFDMFELKDGAEFDTAEPTVSELQEQLSVSQQNYADLTYQLMQNGGL